MRANLAVALVALARLRATAATPDASDFDWSRVQPSESLNYTSCYDGLKCTKLTVPLDWLNPEENTAKVTLAIVALPAVVPEDDASFGGTIIVNPGGPGAPGIDLVLRAGELIQRTADSESRKHEILSFDPRGVGFTEPTSDCFGDEFARGSFALEDRAMGAPDGGIGVIRRKMARAAALGRLCEMKAQGENNIRSFMSTSSVARDMVEIVDKLAEMRKANRKDEDGREERLELRSETEKDDTPRIQYWGLSYGTVLGNYFASMFPGRVGRMILEAVEDPQDYFNTTWVLNLADTQKVLDHFYETCYEGGTRCALFEPADSSPSDIRHRVRALLDSLDESPAPYLVSNSAVSITKQDVLDVIFRALYEPLMYFPNLAVSLKEATQGNFTSIYKSLGLPAFESSCPTRSPRSYTWVRDSQSAIACGDGEPQTNLTADEFAAYVDRLKADSPDFGAPWAHIRLSCTGWRFKPAYRFAGPWTTPEADPSLVRGKPAAPILFVSSQFDTVTPLSNARAASQRHPGSAVLVQDNYAHGAALVPSKCREDFVKRYFATGELSEKEVWCKSDCRPFQECAALRESRGRMRAWSSHPLLGMGL